MQFIINNATILGFSQQGEFFDGDFRFGNRRIISLECLSTDISNESGASAHAVRDLLYLSKTDDYQRVHINGISFDTVKFNSFAVDGDDWVRGANCSIELEAYEEGTIESNLGGSYYEGLDFGGLAHFLDDFSEDFSFERSENSITYTHQVSLKFSEAVEIASSPRLTGPIALAKEFAGKLFQTKSAGRPDFAFTDSQLQSIYQTFDDDHHRTISEDYDNINNTCSFTENFTAYENIDGSNNYSTKATQSFEYGGDGIITVREKGEILGLLTDNYAAAENALDSVIATATGNINNVFNHYKNLTKSDQECDIPDLVSNAADTGPRLISHGKTINIYEGIISYDIQATNDPAKGSEANHSYTTSVRLNGDYFIASEEGNIEGVAEPLGPVIAGSELDYQKFDQARSKFNTEDSLIDTRVKALITNPSPSYISNSETNSKLKGAISYSRSFSNEPRYKDNDGILKQITVDIKTEQKIARKAVESIVNSPLPEGEEKISTEGGAQLVQIVRRDGIPIGYSLPTKSNSIRMVGKRDSQMVNMLNTVTGVIDPGDNYIQNCTYSFNDENTMQLNIDFTWQ